VTSANNPLQQSHDPRKRYQWLDSILIFLLTALLIRPLFKAKYLHFWGSIECTFIADARFLIAHWPHPSWQPLWYLGTRWDYIYPPALRYGTAMFSMAAGWWPVKAYHIYIAFFYCVGMAGVYLLIRVGSNSRVAAWLGAAATALMSPSFLFLTEMRHDAWRLTPERLGALVKYGEGPHITALALLPFALVFSWRALDDLRPAWVALASIFSAAVVAHNFYGATALAMFFPVLVWSHWITKRTARILVPAIAIPVLAYGLTAFWLVPSYLKITTANMKLVSHPGNARSLGIAIIAAGVYAGATAWLARDRRDRTWPVFVSGCIVFFSLDVLGNYYFNFRVYGEPLRLVPELDLILIMGVLLIVVRLWRMRSKASRAAAIAIVLIPFATTAGYLRHAWTMFPLGPNYEERVEYRMQDWIWKNMRDARVFPIGSVRLWFDTWHDLTQLGGGSDQGVLNGIVVPAQWVVTQAPNPEQPVLWMQCLGVDAVYVSDQRSQEVYKDFAQPKKFENVLSPVYDDGKGNIIYRVPRRYAALARVVNNNNLRYAKSREELEEGEHLRRYYEAVERGPDSPVELIRTSIESVRLKARLAPGESLMVQESYDPAWEASSGGGKLNIRKDAMGFMLIDAPPGDREIDLAFVTPFENRVGRVVSVVTAITILGLFIIGFVFQSRRN
jgi:hypothetical protein